MISGTFKIFLFSEPDFEAIFLEKGALSDFDFHFFSDTMGPSFVPPVHFWRSPFSISIHFLARGVTPLMLEKRHDFFFNSFAVDTFDIRKKT